MAKYTRKEEPKKQVKKQEEAKPVVHERKHKTNNNSGLQSGVNRKTYG